MDNTAPTTIGPFLASGAPDLRYWLRAFAAALHKGHIYVEDRDASVLKPLVPRRAQVELLKLMIQTADEKLPIRVLVPKARKQGLSTIIQSLYAWLCEQIPRLRAITLAQTATDTEAIFRLAKVAYENLPEVHEAGAPGISARSITFRNGSEYYCRTAGAKAVGRGDTFQLAHFSEVAFYQTVAGMDKESLRAALNSVPMQPHTIIVLESTGDGPKGEFYERCDAVGREGTDPLNPFKLLFSPWWWDDGYTEVAPDDWEVPADLEELREQFDLTRDQIYYYAIKRAESSGHSIGTTGHEFRREFPSVLRDSFLGAEGLVYPSFGESNKQDLGEPTGEGWEYVRGIDFGFSSTDALVCIFAAIDRSKPPGLIIHPRCKNTIREHEGYKIDAKTGQPEDKDDHTCFTGDTLVCDKELGWVRIDQLVNQHGYCLTPIGWQPYSCISRGVQDTIRTYFNDGSYITSTPEHKLLTENGWCEIGLLALCEAEVITVETERIKPSCVIGHAAGVFGNSVQEDTIQWRDGLLQEQQKLSSHRGTSITSCSLEVPQWPSPERAFCTHSSHKWESGRQSDIQLTTANKQSAYVVARKNRKAGSLVQKGERNFTPEQKNGSWSYPTHQNDEGLVGVGNAERLHLPDMRRNFFFEAYRRKSNKVLWGKLQGSSNLLEKKEGRIAVRRAQMGANQVYDLVVNNAHCFVLQNGVVASNCDPIRYIVCGRGANVSGLLYVYNEIFLLNATTVRLDGFAKLVHQASGWLIPEGDLTKSYPGPNAYKFEVGVADRSQAGMIAQLCHWGIPCVGQKKPVLAPGYRERGEKLDGCALVSTLIAGTQKFYKDKVDMHLTAYESAVKKLTGMRPARLTDDERRALEKYAMPTMPGRGVRDGMRAALDSSLYS